VFCQCFCVSFKILNHGGHRGNTAQVLAQWRHLVASHEATDALHWAMCITPHGLGNMGIKVVINLPAFL
jgi:hypothetical protein